MSESGRDEDWWRSYGEFGKHRHLLVLLDVVRRAGIDRECDLVVVLPPDVLAGVTQAYGLDVIRADIPEPLLGLRPVQGIPEPEEDETGGR